MIKIDPIKLFLIVCAGCLLTGCGIHYTVKGQVVDAVTRQPVQGAVVAINWWRYKLFSPITYGRDRVEYGASDSVTDGQGVFAIPKYLAGEFVMGVYKAGYICWSSQTIFSPEGKTYKEMYLPRQNFNPHNGMVIELQPIAGKGFPVVKHSRFVAGVNRRIESRKFADITLKERKIDEEDYIKRNKKRK
jgi:hypothetical protein